MSVRSAAISCLMPQCEKFNTPKPRISFVVPFSPQSAQATETRPQIHKRELQYPISFSKEYIFFQNGRENFLNFIISRHTIFLSQNFKSFKLDKIIFSVRIGKYEPEVELFRGLYALWYCCRYLQGKFVHHHRPPWPTSSSSLIFFL